MKTEQQTLSELFGPRSVWRGNVYCYSVEFCDLCDCAVIQCSGCTNSSCNGSGCDKCIEDFREFNKSKIDIKQYLTPEECRTYNKIRTIKKLMLNTLGSHKSIPFTELKKDGRLSKNDERLLKDFLC